MANANTSDFLSVNGGVDKDAIALKVYSGMILEAFNKVTTTEGRVVTRTISSGKSAQFPVIGRVSTLTHARGEEVATQALEVNSNEKVIAIEDILMSPIFIDILDEAKTHFEIRRPYATQQGQALAEESDRRSFMALAEAANSATPNFTGGDAGTVDVQADVATNVSELIASIYDAAEVLDLNSVPAAERTLWLAPSQYYLLLNNGEFIDSDFNDANGNRSHAVMRNAADFEIVKTTNLPSSDESANADLPSGQDLDYRNLVAIAAHSSAAGMVSLMGLMFESEYDINRQGHLLIAKYARGFGALRPEAAVALASAAL
tara:strand:+ start:4341 stop:5294 length:954 start_codon:yes stop_codon:yes gene_type:complete